MTTLKLVAQKPSVEITVTSKDASGKSSSIQVGFKRYKTKASIARTKAYELVVQDPNFDIQDSQELDDFLKEEILYLKNVAIPAENERGETIIIKVPDTRTAKKVETLWETPKGCLAALLDAYFQWSSWRVSFISAVQAALVDMNFDEGSRKNS